MLTPCLWVWFSASILIWAGCMYRWRCLNDSSDFNVLMPVLGCISSLVCLSTMVYHVDSMATGVIGFVATIAWLACAGTLFLGDPE